jgi:hypothetical protein
MLHLVDGLVVLVLAEFLQAPIFVHARMQEVLVDGDQFVTKNLVQVLNDLLVAFHDRSCCFNDRDDLEFSAWFSLMSNLSS